jgi:triosephosphate isomerase
VAVQVNDIPNCVETEIECWTQKLELTASEYDGTLLNHSDYLLPWNELAIQTARCTIAGISFCVCVNSFQEAEKAAKFLPDYIAYEPHELIGDKNKSVSTEKPDVIQHLISNIKLPVLIGAGIHSPEDIRIGLKLGAKGFLLATDVVKAVDPYHELLELANAFGTTSPAGFPS